MPQNKETGAAANRFGKQAAGKIAGLLGLKRLSNVSNEVLYQGRRAVIKSAHLGNGYIGVTLNMLERVEIIIAAFENTDAHYELYSLGVETYKRHYRIGYHESIALVLKKVFMEEGTYIKTLKIELNE